jgi:molybdopterin molybdotransferase
MMARSERLVDQTGPAAISVAEARHLVLAKIVPLAPQRVVIGGAAGQVLAETVLAAEAVPWFANSAMDGYAVRAADVADAPVRLRVTGTVAAGGEPGAALARGAAVRIMTGAPLPPGADAVCMIEHVQVRGGGSAVLIETAVRPGTNVRYPGEDIAAGSEVFSSGTQLRPAHIGVLASLGIQSLLVCPRPRVGVLSTGSELAGPGGALVPGKIRDANRPALLAQLGADGFRGVDLGAGRDDRDALSHLLTAGASRCDAIVASGGVSAGDHDVLKGALEKLGGATMRSLHVAVKPGKHVAFALLGERRVPAFGLPGNPVAALVAYELYVRPALRAMAGCPVLDRPRITAIAETDLPRRPGPRLHLARVTARTGPGGVLRVRLSGGQESHMLRAMAQANALALLPDGGGVRAGGRVDVLLLDTEGLGSDGAITLA